MPRQTLFPDAERASLLRPPQLATELARHYTFYESDLALVGQRRGDANRPGFAVQLCLLRFPSQGLAVGGSVDDAVLQWVSCQLEVDAAC